MQAELTADEQAQRKAIEETWARVNATRIAGIRDRVKGGVAGMVADLSQKGVNPMIGVMLGSLTGVLNTWLDHASNDDIDQMLGKITSIVASWQSPDDGEEPGEPPL